MPIEQVLVVNFAALILLLLVIRWLAAPPKGLGDAAALRRLVAAGQAGPAPAHLVIGRDNRVAVALDAGSESACLIFLLGARPVVWRVPAARLRPPLARYDQTSDSLIIETGETTKRRLTLQLPERDPQADRLRTVESEPAAAA
jgi:hypothetical protein